VALAHWGLLRQNKEKKKKRKINQPENDSKLEPKHVVERNNLRIYLNKIFN